MLYQVKALGKSYQEVAECLNVDKSTVSRIIDLYESSSDVAPKRYPPNSGTSTYILTEVDNLRSCVIDKPGVYVPRNLGICAISRLRCSFSES